MYIYRNQYIDAISEFMDMPELVKIVTGMRRTGKSVLFEQIKELLLARGVPSSNVLSYNFEDFTHLKLLDAVSLHDELRPKLEEMQGPKYLFLDEVQEVADWERCVNSLRAATDTDIYLTGSNAHLLAGEYATLMSGRYIEIKMYPFSFSEFSELASMKGIEFNPEKTFDLYQLLGGLPFASSIGLDGIDSKAYLKDVFNSVLIKDVIDRKKIRDADMLRRVVMYAISNIGKTFSARSISRYLKSEMRDIAPETILNYLQACEEAFLLERVKRYDVLVKKQLAVNEKFYVTDHGLREALYGNNVRDIELVLENIVCLELLRRGYQVHVGDNAGYEIDFIGEKSGNRIYIQVCYLMESPETREREFRVLRGVQDNFRKYVVSKDRVDFSHDGIIHKNITDFLLDESWSN